MSLIRRKAFIMNSIHLILPSGFGQYNRLLGGLREPELDLRLGLNRLASCWVVSHTRPCGAR